MSRFKRDPFSYADLDAAKGDEARNRLIFDWWCDEDDRRSYLEDIARLDGGKPLMIRCRAPLADDPAPHATDEAPQGFRDVYLITHPDHVREALTDHETFSNVPYALLGGGNFLLAQDPPLKSSKKFDWHKAQQELITTALAYNAEGLQALAERCVEQAELTSLARPDFDLAEFAEQAALRYLGQLYGYAYHDHTLLEDASRATYRALQYIAIGQHFVTEPLTVPAAQQALGRLAARNAQLMEDYTRLERSPRKYRRSNDTWPDGVQAWSDLDWAGKLGGEPTGPVLKRLPGLESPLSGRDRAVISATLLAGTVGNIQAAVCLVMQELLASEKAQKSNEANQANQANGTKEAKPSALQRMREIDNGADFEKAIGALVLSNPPLPVVPRRTLKAAQSGVPGGKNCLLLLEALQFAPPDKSGKSACPHAWGKLSDDSKAPDPAIHGCLGKALSLPLIAALVRRTIDLQGLKAALDPLDSEELKLERLWGFGCTRYPLRYERDRVRTQHNLIVVMRVKPPISENAARLRRLIAAAVPRVEYELTIYGHLHFAWFEFSDDQTQLVLRTIYDGDFDSYIQHFAMRAGDLFDGLFEFLEGGSPRPVIEHPREFVETIRRHNRAPVADYLYSAYPATKADVIRGKAKEYRDAQAKAQEQRMREQKQRMQERKQRMQGQEP